MATGWRSGTAGVDRVDLVARLQLYALSASAPFFLLLIAGAYPHPRAAATVFLLLVSLAHTVACLALLRAGIPALLGDDRPAAWLIGLAAAITPVGGLLSLAAFPASGSGLRFSVQGGAAALTFCAGLLGALSPLLSRTQMVLATVVPSALIELVQIATGAGGRPPWAVNYAIVAVSVLVSYRSTCWFLSVLWELARGRDARAQLAVAEERLRFARDLHDVLGRNLALIAVNSELADELIQRGDPTATGHLQQVRRIAQDSVRELRAVVGGYRSADLDVELAGARSLLRAAGIRVRVIGDGAELPDPARAAFGWVIREATTNIIRHSEPTHVTIELDVRADVDPRTALLRIDNDGLDVRAAGVTALLGSGHGLAGLRQRLETLGGELVTESLPAGTFSLRARLPLPVSVAPQSAEPVT